MRSIKLGIWGRTVARRDPIFSLFLVAVAKDNILNLQLTADHQKPSRGPNADLS